MPASLRVDSIFKLWTSNSHSSNQNLYFNSHSWFSRVQNPTLPLSGVTGETCFNWILSKPKSCINWALNKVLMLAMYVNLTCIYWAPVYSKCKKKVPRMFGLDRFHCTKSHCIFRSPLFWYFFRIMKNKLTGLNLFFSRNKKKLTQ
jgi:hypothetical protein